MSKDRVILLALIILAVVIGEFLSQAVVTPFTDKHVGRLKA